MTRLAIFGGEPVRKEPFALWPQFDEREKAALIEVLESGVWGGYSPKVAEFEQAFADFHEAKYGVTAANGTVTLEAALNAAGIRAGDEVIVPPISFIATATAVLRVGAVPVFADIDESTYNLDPARAREAVTGRTRAIIPVHFAGQPADMDALIELAERRDLVVIEDCAHAHGATWRGRRVGGFGAFGSFSFQASKNMTGGEGGILITNDGELAEASRSVCNQGRRTGFWHLLQWRSRALELPILVPAGIFSHPTFPLKNQSARHHVIEKSAVMTYQQQGPSVIGQQVFQ